LLDEPTSALDPNAEHEVLVTLNRLRKTVGIVIVAHRLTTVQAADNIYVLESGRVVESGSWSELITRRDRFHALAKLQQIVA
jgi:ABC-type multidrug transport system fused ATPase/permease subunit